MSGMFLKNKLNGADLSFKIGKLELFMRPQLYKLPIAPDTSFLYIDEECKYFDKPWHFHKEYEMVYINKTKGIRFIGYQVSFFDDGDLVLLGPNIPHLYRNSEEYYKTIN